ncbi:MAG: hypothetical protein JWO47_1077 [Candidatus Saccharibacteria bacterium]|nr:hypothetical protein [Candidatus Saccharibacteria bacterium]
MKLDIKIWVMGAIAVILGVFGFTTVSKAGHGVIGGVMILLAGLIEGHVLGEVYDAGEKSKRDNKK